MVRDNDGKSKDLGSVLGTSVSQSVKEDTSVPLIHRATGRIHQFLKCFLVIGHARCTFHMRISKCFINNECSLTTPL